MNELDTCKFDNRELADRPEEFPFSPFDLQLEKAIERLKGRPKHCLRNAFRGLRKSWLIAKIDPEMALFRGITAEEEAATALIYALKIRQYPGASKLNPMRHDDKNGLMPFLDSIYQMLATSSFPQIMIELKPDDDPPRIEIHIPSENMGLPAGKKITPNEPLNVLVSAGSDDSPTTVAMFEQQLQDLASERGQANIRELIDKRANFRNQLLYAAENGIPTVQPDDALLIARRRTVLILAGLTIAVMQSREHQLLAKQGVEAFLKALGRAVSETFDYTIDYAPSDFYLEVIGNGIDAPSASLKPRTEALALNNSDMNFKIYNASASTIFVQNSHFEHVNPRFHSGL